MTVVAEVKADPDNNRFDESRKGIRLVNPDFASFFDTPKKSAEELTSIYRTLKGKSKYSSLKNQTSVVKMGNALREFEEKNMSADQKRLIPSNDEFFGISKGKNRINKFLTWVYVPAVKDAVAESEEARNSHLGKLIQHTVRLSMNYQAELDKLIKDTTTKYGKLLSDQQKHLSKLENSLLLRLQEAVTGPAGIELNWRLDEKSVTISEPTASFRLIDSGFSGEVHNFGHGLQRTFLLVLLQELVQDENHENPTLILGCEEPELYQHPPQARHLASVFRQLSNKDAQILLTSHSPYFVDIKSINGLKKVHKVGRHSKVHVGNLENLTEKYNESFDVVEHKIDAVSAKLCLQLQPRANEIFLSEFVVLVEGISDRTYLECCMELSGEMQKFQKLGGNIIEAGGKCSLVLLLLLVLQYNIPYYVIFDCDGNEKDKAMFAIRMR